MADDYTENQCWIHIHDNIGSFSSTKKIRHVHDIFTSKNYFCVDLNNIEFSGIEIIGRGANSELLYLENDGEIRVSLDPLDRWPEAPKYSKKTKHVKVDVGYTLIQPNFDKNYFKTGYTSLMGMPKNIYPEFHIYLPKGLEINANNVFVTILIEDEKGQKSDYLFTNHKSKTQRLTKQIKKVSNFFSKENSENQPQEPTNEKLEEETGKNPKELKEKTKQKTGKNPKELKQKTGKNPKELKQKTGKNPKELKKNNPPLNFHKNPIENKFSILLDSEEFNKLKKIDISYPEIILKYEVKNSNEFFSIIIFSILVLALSIVEISHFDLIGIPFIAFISLGALYLGLLNQGYEIPYNKIVGIILTISLLILFSKCVYLVTVNH